jgi:hypothetical protein
LAPPEELLEDALEVDDDDDDAAGLAELPPSDDDEVDELLESELFVSDLLSAEAFDLSALAVPERESLR